ncbi:MAG: ABC transporter permease subunit [Polyangiaceae bacterium]|nr:ABC transporter permease subunit [Polyangiaceae bacterium]
MSETTLASGRARSPRSGRAVGGTPMAHRLAEKLIAIVAWASVAAVLSLVTFIAREAAPLVEQPLGQLRDLLWPRQWPGYDAAVYIWQPVGLPPKYNVVPLLVGTLKMSGLAMLLAAPLALLAAVYVAELAPPRQREVLKPLIELLAGIPSVVLGFFTLSFVASAAQALLGLTYRLNALAAALGLGLAIVPVIFTVAEDALRTVPAALREGAAALGARRWQTTLRVVIPSALPAVGETMIVLMASGNAAVVDLNPASGARSVTATIAAELGETARGGEHWRVLFALGLLLFALTWIIGKVGDLAIARLRRGWQGSEGGS